MKKQRAGLMEDKLVVSVLRGDSLAKKNHVNTVHPTYEALLLNYYLHVLITDK